MRWPRQTRRLSIANRTLARAEALCDLIARGLPGARLSAHGFPSALPELAAGAELVVNATSLGLHGAADPLPWDPAVPFRAGQVVYDLVYSSARDAAACPGRGRRPGRRTIDGLGMLVQQGARSFEWWTGQPAPVDVMAAAVTGP